MMDWWKKQKLYIKVYLTYYLIASIFSIVFVGSIIIHSIFFFHVITILLFILIKLKKIRVVYIPFMYIVSLISLIFATLICYVDVNGASMEPMIPNHSKVFVWQQKFNIERNMIVIFTKEYDVPDETITEESSFIKRVQGVPGDHIDFVTPDSIRINNGDEVYLLYGIGQNIILSQLIDGRIPENYYFLVGDNRPSLDSRYFGFVHKDEIVGMYLFHF